MRRLLRPTAALVLTLALAAGGAGAREHDGGEHGHGGDRGQERSAPPGWARRGGERGPERGGERGGDRGGGPPPWSHGGGRWERPPEAYGPPVGAYPAPGPYRARRGGYLPPEARGGVVQDYGRFRLRQPPRGYAWVRSGRAMMLMDMNTGQVFDVIPD